MTRIIGAAPGRPAEAAVVLIERPAGLPLPTTPPMPAAPPSTLPVLDAAADPAPAAPPSIPPLHGDVAVAQASQVIARHILAADAQGGGRELRFRLAPGTLGTVEVRVEDKPAGVEVRLLADTLAARDHLAAQGGELRQLLDAVQPGPVAVRVELRPERDAGGPWQHAAHDHQPPEQRRRHAFRASQDLTGEEDSGAPAGHTDRIDRRI